MHKRTWVWKAPPSGFAVLGQSDLKTTLNIYTHAIPESQKRAVAKVAGLVFTGVPEFSGVTENGKVN